MEYNEELIMNINCYGLKKVTFTIDQNTDKTQFTERMLL